MVHDDPLSRSWGFELGDFTRFVFHHDCRTVCFTKCYFGRVNSFGYMEFMLVKAKIYGFIFDFDDTQNDCRIVLLVFQVLQKNSNYNRQNST